jgi:uncharacterized protein (DUF1684 family)
MSWISKEEAKRQLRNETGKKWSWCEAKAKELAIPDGKQYTVHTAVLNAAIKDANTPPTQPQQTTVVLSKRNLERLMA